MVDHGTHLKAVNHPVRKEMLRFKELYRRHVKLECQDVPHCRKQDLARLLHFDRGE